MKNNYLINLFSLGIFIALAFGVYHNALDNGFTMDDAPAIVVNPLIRDLGNIPQIIISPYTREVNPTSYLYRPLTSVTYALSYAIDGLNPTIFFMGNILLHALNAFLVFLLFNYWFDRKWLGFMAALLFIVHPIQTDVIPSGVGRTGLLLTFFSLLSILCYIKSKNSKVNYFLSLFFYFCAMLSKETGAFLIVFLALYTFFEKSDLSLKAYFKKNIIYDIGFGITFIIYFFLRLAVVKVFFVPQVFVFNPLIGRSALVRILTGLKILVYYYIRLMVYPDKLCALYAYDQIEIVDSPFELSFLISLLIMILFAGIIFYFYKKSNKAYLGLLLFISNIFFYSNVPFLSGAIVAERFLYLSSVGFVIFVLSIYLLLKKRVLRIIFLFFIGTIVILFSLKTIERSRVWQNNLTLFKSVVEVFPRNAIAHYYLGREYLQEDDLQPAIDHFQKAVVIYPKLYKAYTFLGFAYAWVGDHEKAIRYYGEGLDNLKGTSELWLKYGYSYSILDMHTEAFQAYLTSLELNPENTITRYHLAELYRKMGNPQKAINEIKKLLTYYPRESFLFNSLANIYWEMGEEDQANDYWKKAIEAEEWYQYDPEKPFHFDLGLTYADWGDAESAIMEYELRLEQGRDDYEVWLNMGRAYFSLRKYGKALESYQKAAGKTSANIYLHFLLAKTYFILDEYRNSIDEYLFLIDKYPDLYFLWYQLGLNYYEMGNITSAKDSLEKAVELNPNYKPAKKMLGRLE
jgi:tetratricopeptide (TPR) repeat protein